MFDYVQRAREVISDLLSKNIKSFAIYPYGEKGKLVENVLREYYGISDIVIFDNILAEKHNNIYNISDVQKHVNDKIVLLICSDKTQCYEEIRNMLYSFIEKKRCVDLFPLELTCLKPLDDEFERILYAMNMSKKKGDGYFSPSKTNSKFFLPFYTTDLIQSIIYTSEDYFEKALLDEVVNYKNGIIYNSINDGCVLDIGANIGNHTLFYCNECHAKKVLAFEPVSLTCEILKENIRINNLEDKVEIYQRGVGRCEGKAAVPAYNLNNIGGTGLFYDLSWGNVDVIALDDLTFSMPVNFVKIDVEGMEEQVLLGAEKFFKANHPYVSIESFPNKYKAVNDLLISMGYECVKKMGPNDYLYA